jgi:hypothetical protein
MPLAFTVLGYGGEQLMSTPEPPGRPSRLGRLTRLGRPSRYVRLGRVSGCVRPIVKQRSGGSEKWQLSQ